MMKSLLLVLVSFTMFMACTSDPAVKTNTTPASNIPGVSNQGSEVIAQYDNISQEQAEKIMAERKAEKAAEIAENLPGYRAHAKELVKERSSKEKAMATMTTDHWAYEFVFSGSEMSKKGAYDGHWLKFEDDHTYTYGVGEQVNGAGKYHYSIQTDKMIMVDDRDDMMPEEWEIKAQDEVMIMVGSGYFGNNPRQCKMLRWNGRPAVSAATI